MNFCVAAYLAFFSINVELELSASFKDGPEVLRGFVQYEGLRIAITFCVYYSPRSENFELFTVGPDPSKTTLIETFPFRR